MWHNICHILNVISTYTDGHIQRLPGLLAYMRVAFNDGILEAALEEM